jgi:hypothetical protein
MQDAPAVWKARSASWAGPKPVGSWSTKHQCGSAAGASLAFRACDCRTLAYAVPWGRQTHHQLEAERPASGESPPRSAYRPDLEAGASAASATGARTASQTAGQAGGTPGARAGATSQTRRSPGTPAGASPDTGAVCPTTNATGCFFVRRYTGPQGYLPTFPSVAQTRSRSAGSSDPIPPQRKPPSSESTSAERGARGEATLSARVGEFASGAVGSHS